jgi:hypothetical protein
VEKPGTDHGAIGVFGKTHIGQPFADLLPQGDFDHPEGSPIGHIG